MRDCVSPMLGVQLRHRLLTPSGVAAPSGRRPLLSALVLRPRPPASVPRGMEGLNGKPQVG
jgi:hypothetical protein